jgi:hypothetical protein
VRYYDKETIEEVEAHIADAVKKGARVVTGGKRSALGGTSFEPTVLTDATIMKGRPSAQSRRSTASRPTLEAIEHPAPPEVCRAASGDVIRSCASDGRTRERKDPAQPVEPGE